jgi:hypothetical protein
MRSTALTACGKAFALRQGMASVVSFRLKKKMGFADCGKTHALYQGTTLVAPNAADVELGFSPCVFRLTAREHVAQGLKPNHFEPFTARLKSCPDTKHEILGASRGTKHEIMRAIQAAPGIGGC